MNSSKALATGVLSLLVAAPVVGAPGVASQILYDESACTEAAARTFDLGDRAYEDGRAADAAKFYSRAAEACNRFDYWMAAGDTWVNDVLADSSATAVRDTGKPAATAVVNAYEAAETNEQRLQASKLMIQLGLLSDDPINARNWLVYSRNELGASDGDLADLRSRIESQETNMTAGQVSRGSGKGGALLFDPLRLSQIGGPQELGGEGGGDNVTGPFSFNLPINFQSNSTETTPDTTGNLIALAESLAGDYPDAQFRLIGHADARGDADYNMALSMRRAEAIRQWLIDQSPALSGRIEAEGKGETEPREPGNTPAAYRSNRRLEVIIEE